MTRYWLAGLALLGVGPCWAGNYVEARVDRTSTHRIVTGGPDFAGAYDDYEVRWDFFAEFDGPLDGVSLDIGRPSNNLVLYAGPTTRDVYAEGIGGVEVTNLQATPTSFRDQVLINLDWHFDGDMVGPVLDASLTLGYASDAVDGSQGGPQLSFLSTRVENARRIMRFRSGTGSLIDNGDGFAMDITLDGRWDPGSDTEGGVVFFGIHDSFEIEEFFVYDSVTDTTRFRAVTDSFRPTPDLKFDLIGAIVPGPTVPAMLAIGGLIGMRRRRA